MNSVKLQKSLTKQALLQYKQSIWDASQEISNATNNVEKAYQQNSQDYKALVSQQEVAELTNTQYQNGLVDFSSVLTAQQNLLTAQNSFISSNANIYSYIISFYKSVGGGYSNNILEYQKADVGEGCGLYKGWYWLFQECHDSLPNNLLTSYILHI